VKRQKNHATLQALTEWAIEISRINSNTGVNANLAYPIKGNPSPGILLLPFYLTPY